MSITDTADLPTYNGTQMGHFVVVCFGFSFWATPVGAQSLFQAVLRGLYGMTGNIQPRLATYKVNNFPTKLLFWPQGMLYITNTGA